MENLYAYNPDTKSFVPAEEWLKDADPARTPLVGIKSGAGILAITKSDCGRYEFQEAQEKTAKIRVEGIDKDFRLPTRREVLDIQDAQDAQFNLNDLLSKVGGYPLEGWYWTSELWFARRVKRQLRLDFPRYQRHPRHQLRQQRASLQGGHAFRRPRSGLNLIFVGRGPSRPTETRSHESLPDHTER
jgi:hypothetical protein